MKTVLITGASRGIGREMALLFAKNGYNLVINYNKSKKEAENLYNEIISLNANALIVKADVSNSSELKLMIDKALSVFGHIDVLINNAGISCRGLLIEETDDITKNIIDINLIGTILMCKNIIPHMLKYGNGKIINISSIWGNVGASLESTYSASKAGIIGLTKSLAKEYGYNNILVNCICPGIINTDMNKNLTKKDLEFLINEIPLGKIGDVKDISALALFLAEKTGDYITGQVITVDGGYTL